MCLLHQEMNLIITPVYNAWDKVAEMCGSVDWLAEMAFLHVLIDDDSYDYSGPMPSITANRKILTIRRSIADEDRKNGQAQAMQMGYDWAHYKFMNEKENPQYEHVFLLESDVIPLDKGFDRKMIDISQTIPEDWATLDMQSVDGEGKLSYPTTVSPRNGIVRDDLEHMHYADFQCTLFHPECFTCGVKWSDFPSHFDALWSRKIEEITGRKHYRTTLVKAFHYAFSSRRTLPGVTMGPSNTK